MKIKPLYDRIVLEPELVQEKTKFGIVLPELVREKGRDMKFVYTPFHGTGNKPVRNILNRIGFENVIVVKEQEKPDGDFPTANDDDT